MFDLSWSELLLVGAIALVVIGPRELPRVLRTIGQTLAKVRRMAGEFQSQFNAAMREAEFDEIRHTVRDVKETASRTMGADVGNAFNPLRAVSDELRNAIQKQDSGTQPSVTSYSADPHLDVSLGEKAKTSSAPVSPAPVYSQSAQSAELHDLTPVAEPLALDVANFSKKPSRRKAKKVIIAAPRDVVKPLSSPPLGATRLYRKVKFSAFPARKRHALQMRTERDEEGNT